MADPIPSYCSCSAPSPVYTPKMESLSDTDLKVLEFLGYAGITFPWDAPFTCDFIQNELIGIRDCWTCLPPRKRQELIVSAFGTTGTADQVRQVLRLIESCATPAQIDAVLAYSRYSFILSALAAP